MLQILGKKRVYILLLTLLTVITTHAQVGQILWEDNFNTFNTYIWNAEDGDGCPDLCGWGNSELQYYQRDNVYIEEIPGEPGNFALVLEAKNQSAGNRNFTSGRVNTKQNLALKYGMVEMRIKVPDDLSTGLWPAAWMLGTNEESEGWPRSGEIDIMEMGQSTQFRNEQELPPTNENNLVGANVIFYDDEACSSENQTCAASIAFDKYYNQPYIGDTPLTDRFLIYRMFWDENEIRLTVEDQGIVQNFYTGPFPIGSTASELKKPFYLLMNLAVGGSFTDASSNTQVTADLPAKMYIDYVRIKQWNGQGKVYLPGEIMANAGADKNLEEGETLFLNAAGSYGSIASYSWTINGEQVSTNETHEVSLNAGTHTIELTVADNNGNQSKDSFLVTIGDQEIGEILWEDNFDSFNTQYWNKDIGDGCDEGICGWGNQELQSYQEDNVYIEEIAEEPGNYALVLEAREETAGNSSFTSGKVTTENKVAIQYGVVEVRMKVPDVENGLWPAAWLLGFDHGTVGWPRSGEIDMMEMGHAQSTREADGHFGSPNNFVAANLLWYNGAACDAENLTCAASIAFDKNYSQPYTPAQAMNNRFMTYRMYWSESQIRLTAVDNGVEYDLYTNPFPIGSNEDAFRKPFYFLLNLAVGGSFTGQMSPSSITAPIPAKMYIDYVKVNRWNGIGEVIYPGKGLLANAGGSQVQDDLDQNGLETITLNGSNSYGNIVSYEWSENGIVLSQEQIAQVDLSVGVHNIQLKVTNESGEVDTDLMTVDIRELLWEEQFDTFDQNVWTAEEGDGCAELCGWGNAELQYYQSDNAYIEEIPGDAGNNALVIEARREQVEGKAFTSARVKTQGNVSVRYGLVETRMKVPDDLSTGLWPAAWLLGANIDEVGWPRSGEIDMMEMGHKAAVRFEEGFENISENDFVGGNIIFYSDEACGGSPDCAASIAFDKYYSKPYVGSSSLTSRFLTYRMYWDPNQIRLTVEDQGVEFDLYTGPFALGRDAEEFHKPFFFLLNLAVGGNFTDAASNSQVTADFPAKMLVDYIRVYKWNGYGEVSGSSGIIANAGPDIIALDEDGDGSEQIVLDATSSTHHTGAIESYSWRLEGEEIATGSTAEITLERGQYTITLVVTDSDNNEATDDVSVTVSNGGLGPVANAGEDQEVEDDNGDDFATVNLDGSASEETNAPIVSYKWFLNGQEIASGVTPSIQLTTGIHEITLEVTDEDESVGSDKVIITVIDPDNQAPIANPGDDIMITDDNGDDLASVSLDASASTDADGEIVKYEWFINDELLESGITVQTTLSTGVYNVVLVVTDNDGVSASSEITVSVVDPDNNLPTADAGEDLLLIDADLDGMERVSLSSNGSTDNDGNIESYSWKINGEEISDDAQFNIDLELGEYTIVLHVTDDDGETATDELIVIVNQLPVANAGDDIVNVDNDANGSQSVRLDASLSTDAAGSIASYEWKYNDQIIGNTVSFDYSFDLGPHEILLTITDNYGSKASDDLTVFISSTNNETPMANAGEDISQRANASGMAEISLDASQSSDPDGNIYKYEWYKGDFQITTGQITTYSFSVGQHNVVLKVTDNEGATASDNLMITVTQPVNLALNKPITTSSEENPGTVGSQAVDGDYGTRWASAFSDPQWIYVDLGKAYSIEGILLEWETAYGSTYEIQVSSDATNWTTLYTENAGDGNTDEFEVSGAGRYVRMYGTARGTEFGYSLYEFEVYGKELGPEADATLTAIQINGVALANFDADTYTYTVTVSESADLTITASPTNTKAQVTINPPSAIPGTATIDVLSEDKEFMLTYTIAFQSQQTGSNLALNKTTTTSTNENAETSGSNAVDGSLQTRWSSAFADPQWISVDLEASYSLSKVVLTWEGAFATNYEIQVSEDNQNWRTIYSVTNGKGGTEEWQVSGKGRYVRMYGTTRATVYGYSLYEFEVYGSSVLSTTNFEEDWKLYPNPSEGIISIEVFNSNEGKTLEILDLAGRVVYSTDITAQNTVITLDELNNGFYLVKMTHEHNVSVKRLLLTR